MVKVFNKKIKSEKLQKELVDNSQKELQERIDSFNNDYNEFRKKMIEKYKFTIGAELVFDKRGIVPRVTLIDVSEEVKKNETN